MLLRSETKTDCRPAAVFEWLSHMDAHYLQWHPDHISCRYINGDSFAPGSILFCQEYIHGRPHKFRMRLTGIEPDARIDYSIAPGMSGSFVIEPEGGGSRVTAEVRLGLNRSFLAGVQDRLLRRFYGWKIDALARHMDEEGSRMKSILETGEAAEVSLGDGGETDVGGKKEVSLDAPPLKLAGSG